MEVTAIETHVFEQLIGALAPLKIGVHLERSARESAGRAGAYLNGEIGKLQGEIETLKAKLEVMEATNSR